jgi:hypothetical protein
MSRQVYIHYEVTPDARRVSVDVLHGPSMVIDRDDALALLETLQEILPQMAVKID